MKKIAVVTGTTGPDGAYPAQRVLSHHNVVHGMFRRASSHARVEADLRRNKLGYLF